MRNRVCLEIVDGPLWNSDRVLESKRCNGATLAKVGYYGAGVAVSLCSMRDIYKPRRPRYPLGIQADEVVVQRGLSDATKSREQVLAGSRRTRFDNLVNLIRLSRMLAFIQV
jgi:hypothetical protein